MKTLKEYEDDIYKCSRCGLCQSVCPVYKVTLNECAVSKGKFNMLNGVLKGDLAMSSQIKRYLDLCTGCNACKNFCPSEIDARKIFIAAKYEYYKNNNPCFIRKFLSSYFLFKIILRFFKAFGFLYRLCGMDKIVSLFEKPLLKTGELSKRILLLNTLLKKDYRAESKRNVKPLKKAVYFEGCFNKYINPQTKDAVEKILFDSGIKLFKRNFECCAVSYLSDGNIKEFKKNVDKNLSLMDFDFDFLVTDCASCNSVLKSYREFSNSNTARKIEKSLISVIDLIKDVHFVSKKKLKIAVHIPCHEDFDLSGIVKNIQNIEYIEADDYDKCCGFSGTFALKNTEISKEISKRKASSYIKSGADIVLTTCPACMLGLEQGFIEMGKTSNSRPKVMNLFVFLAKCCNQV